ncbi:hypothetical protein ACHAWF_001442, partial [Thalassiosira exigua]
QPHGRAWKILDKELLVSEILPRYKITCTKYESFSRQLNAWGLKRLYQSGPDHGCYYHECFLRDLPELTWLIHRLPSNQGKATPYPAGEPNFYRIAERYPLPPPPPVATGGVTGQGAVGSDASAENHIHPQLSRSPSLLGQASAPGGAEAASRLNSLSANPSLGQQWQQPTFHPEHSAQFPAVAQAPFAPTNTAQGHFSQSQGWGQGYGLQEYQLLSHVQAAQEQVPQMELTQAQIASLLRPVPPAFDFPRPDQLSGRGGGDSGGELLPFRRG